MRVSRPLGSGETLPADHFTRLGGGKAANRAFLARRLGLPSWLFGRVGDDELAGQALSPLRDAGVNLDAVSVAEAATAVSVILVPPHGKKSILLSSNANNAWDEAAIAATATRVATAPSRSILTVDYEVPALVVRRAAEAAAARNIPVVIDPSWPQNVEPAVLKRALAVTPNAEEAEVLTGLAVTGPDSAARAAQRVAELGPRFAAIKLEDGGCVLWAEGRSTHIPPAEVATVDTTGAGDAFTAMFAIAMLEGRSAREAAVLATAASHLAVTRWGSQPAYPTRAEIWEFAHRLAPS